MTPNLVKKAYGNILYRQSTADFKSVAAVVYIVLLHACKIQNHGYHPFITTHSGQKLCHKIFIYNFLLINYSKNLSPCP
jgi:hypothetical protein